MTALRAAGAGDAAGLADPWRRVRRVLAIRLDNLGDLLMTTPALAAIGAGSPGRHLTLMTSPAAAAAAPHLPMVDEVLPVRVPWMPGVFARAGDDEAALVRRIAAGHYDAAVIFTVCTQSALPAALLCRMAGVPLRLAHSRENPYALLTDWVREVDEVGPGLDQAPSAGPAGAFDGRGARHEVERQLALVAAVGWTVADDGLRFALRDADRHAVVAQLAAAGVARGRGYAVLHPGATAASRRWPPAHFGAVAAALAVRGFAVVWCGSRDEQPLVEAAWQAARAALPAAADARGAAPIVSLAGRQTLGELAALIEGAQVLVANNSAPAHLAAAVGTPVVDLYALTNPQHGPWRARARLLFHDVPCRNCLSSTCPLGHHDCLRRVEPARALAAALELMQMPPPARPGDGRPAAAAASAAAGTAAAVPVPIRAPSTEARETHA